MNNEVLGTLGLCLRAKKLAVGDDAVADFYETGHARAIIITADAGESIKRKVNFYAKNKNVSILYLPYSKEELGKALGKVSCSICCISDSGFAASISRKLADASHRNAEEAVKLESKNERIIKRKNKVKKSTDKKEEIKYIDIDEEEYNKRFQKNNNGGER